jgi:type II secretory pathway pseudopilin PulG
MNALTRLAAKFRCDTGFTLVEAIVAMFVAVILFSVLGTVLAASALQAREARHQEEATQLSIEGIEVVRALPWAELAMVAVEPGDTRVSGGQLLATAADLPADETLVVDGTDGSVQAKYSVTIDSFTFDVWTYVTEVQPELRRAVVFVTWSSRGGVRSHHTTALISELRAG